jgi:hypothetical protein
VVLYDRVSLMLSVHRRAVHIGNVITAYTYCSSVRQKGRRKYFVQKNFFIAVCLKEKCSSVCVCVGGGAPKQINLNFSCNNNKKF